MKLFIKKLSLLSLLFGSVLLLYLLLYTLLSSYNKREAYIKGFFVKQEMLVQKHRQKIPSVILLGGSNVAFGFNSERLQDSLNRPVINTGLNCELGLQFILDHTSKYLMKGDLLVIAPEYEHFFNDFAYGKMFLAALFFMNPSIRSDLNVRQFMAITSSIPVIIEALLPPVFSTKRKVYVYTVSGFNKLGDYTEHWTLPPCPYEHVSPEDFGKINLDFLNYYENTVETLRNQGIEVLLIPPPFPETSYRIVEEKLLPLFAEFEKRNLNFSISPQESTYADSLFFDTCYHLRYEGVMIRTNRLIRQIKDDKKITRRQF